MKRIFSTLICLFFFSAISAKGQSVSSQELNPREKVLRQASSNKINAQIINQLKKGEFSAPPHARNLSYKMQMFSYTGYTVSDVLKWLPSFTAQLPQEQQPLFIRAREILSQGFVPNAARQPAALNQQQVFEKWLNFLNKQKPLPINGQDKNPFALPDLQNARVILIGEDHTMHYPTEQLVEYLIAYNKSAPQDKRITHLFVEFSYQGNLAMEFIRTHLNDLPEKELLKEAVNYSHQKMDKHISATLREEVRWLRLGYRLLKEAPDIVFYAYDIPNPSIEKRNSAAMAFLQAGYEQPHTKMVFIGGALHMLRENLNTPLFSDPSINAQNSLAHTPKVAPGDMVSIFAVGGMPWTEDLKLYGSGNEADLYHMLLALYQKSTKNLAFKTPAKFFGFDYYFYFNSFGKPAVTDANTW